MSLQSTWKKIKDWAEQYESFWHSAMGFGAELTNTRIFLLRRERKQQPFENDRHPARFIIPGQPTSYTTQVPDSEEHWSKARVNDSFDDMEEEHYGGTVAWFFVVGLSFLAGALIF